MDYWNSLGVGQKQKGRHLGSYLRRMIWVLNQSVTYERRHGTNENSALIQFPDLLEKSGRSS